MTRLHKLSFGSGLFGLASIGLLLALACGSPKTSSSPNSGGGSSGVTGGVTGGLTGGESISSKQAGDLGLALRVTYRDTRKATPIRIELVSHSHTDAVELYSKKRASADTKVQTDKAIYALLQEFDARGFNKHAQSGRAPESILLCIEVQDASGTRYFPRFKGQPAPTQKVFGDCLSLLNLVYNETEGLQTIENRSGGALFDQQKHKLGSKP